MSARWEGQRCLGNVSGRVSRVYGGGLSHERVGGGGARAQERFGGYGGGRACPGRRCHGNALPRDGGGAAGGGFGEGH